MLGTQHLALFVISGILLNLTPGQDTLYIVGRSVAQGRRAGLLSVLGILSGTVVHTLAATFGLAALLAASPRAFTLIKAAGALYLTYLGGTMLVARAASAAAPPLARAHERDWVIYRAGLLTNVLNPKVALFFLAFLPQFVAPGIGAGARILAFLFLGAVFIVDGGLWCLVLVWGASAMSRRFRERSSAGQWLTRAAGLVFLGLGVRLASGR